MAKYELFIFLIIRSGVSDADNSQVTERAISCKDPILFGGLPVHLRDQHFPAYTTLEHVRKAPVYFHGYQKTAPVNLIGGIRLKEDKSDPVLMKAYSLRKMSPLPQIALYLSM